MIPQLFLSFVFSLIFFAREKSGWFGILYLAFLPFIIFSGLEPLLLFISLLLGYLLFCLFRKPTASNFVIFIIVVITSLAIVQPRSGIDLGMLNAINSQRGEHSDFENSLLPKLLHNKSDLFQSFINNFDKLLSPVAIFASGFWHNISPYYPLGFLFPWDLFFIYYFFKNQSTSWTRKSYWFFAVALILLILLTGFVYLDQAEVYCFAVVYFLAILAFLGYSQSSIKTRYIFLLINSIYLVYHLVVTSYFPI